MCVNEEAADSNYGAAALRSSSREGKAALLLIEGRAITYVGEMALGSCMASLA